MQGGLNQYSECWRIFFFFFFTMFTYPTHKIIMHEDNGTETRTNAWRRMLDSSRRQVKRRSDMHPWFCLYHDMCMDCLNRECLQYFKRKSPPKPEQADIMKPVKAEAPERPCRHGYRHCLWTRVHMVHGRP